MTDLESEPKVQHIKEENHRENVEYEKPHGYIDPETAAYTAGAAIHIDDKTRKQLFWKINRRILACMLGVSLMVIR